MITSLSPEDLLDFLAEALGAPGQADEEEQFGPPEPVVLANPPPYSIDGFGDVVAEAIKMDLTCHPVLNVLADSLSSADRVEINFKMDGTVIAQTSIIVLQLFDYDLMELAHESPVIAGLACRFCDPIGDLLPNAAAVWPSASLWPPDRLGWIRRLVVAPIFQSDELLKHVLCVVRHTLDSMSSDVEPWALCVEAPTPAQAQSDPSGLWDDEADSSLEWTRATLVKLGCVQAGPVDHSFLRNEVARICPNHPDLYLVPHP